MNHWQRAALVSVAAAAFLLDRAEADCAISIYSVEMTLASATPPDESWPTNVELRQSDDTTIAWMAATGNEQTVDLRAERR